jgi:hypothetical protein
MTPAISKCLSNVEEAQGRAGLLIASAGCQHKLAKKLDTFFSNKQQ